MENAGGLKRQMDELVLEGRNNSYEAYKLSWLYDKHMTRGMLVGILLFLLGIASPQIVRMIKVFLPEEETELIMKEVTLADPSPIDPKKPEPEPPPKVKPPP